MAYNTYIRIDGMPLIVALLAGGFFATVVGIFFGIPSLRVKGLIWQWQLWRRSFFVTGPFCALGGSLITPRQVRCPSLT
jgi:branched-chain amino acid transport system permease protein